MQINPAASAASAWTHPVATLRSPSRPAVTGAAPSTPTEEPRTAVPRQAVMRLIASEVLQALGQELRASRNDPPGRGGYEPRDAGGIGAVARALRDAVASGSDEAVAGTLEKVEGGIDNARQALSRLGYDAADIDAAAAQFKDRVGGRLAAFADVPTQSASEFSASARMTRKERGSLELTTQDGDVVRIQFRNTEKQRLALGSVDVGGTQATSVQIASTQRLRSSIEVTGNIDADELQAIQDFVGKIDALANDFFGGDIEAAFAAGSALEFDANEIARFSLKLSVTERVQASATQSYTGPGRVPQIVPADEGGVSSGVSSSAAPIGKQADAVEASTAAGAAPEVDARARTGKKGPGPTSASSPRDSIQAFVQRAFAAADAPLSVQGFKLAWSVKVQLAAETVAAGSAVQAKNDNASKLLVDVLESAASQSGATSTQPRTEQAA